MKTFKPDIQPQMEHKHQCLYFKSGEPREIIHELTQESSLWIEDNVILQYPLKLNNKIMPNKLPVNKTPRLGGEMHKQCLTKYVFISKNLCTQYILDWRDS